MLVSSWLSSDYDWAAKRAYMCHSHALLGKVNVSTHKDSSVHNF